MILCATSPSHCQALNSIFCPRFQGQEEATLARLAPPGDGLAQSFQGILPWSRPRGARPSHPAAGHRRGALSERGAPAAVYSWNGLSGTGTTGNVVKMRLAASSSTATALNSPAASQRAGAAQSDVLAPGNCSSIKKLAGPLASKGILAASRRPLSRHHSHRSSPGLDSRLWRAAAVLIPPSRRRTRGNRGCTARRHPVHHLPQHN